MDFLFFIQRDVYWEISFPVDYNHSCHLEVQKGANLHEYYSLTHNKELLFCTQYYSLVHLYVIYYHYPLPLQLEEHYYLSEVVINTIQKKM